MPLAGREQLDLGFTIAMTLFVVAAFATLRPEPADAVLIVAVFLVQLIYPATFIRFAAASSSSPSTLSARHRHVRPVLRAAFGRRDAPEQPRVERKGPLDALGHGWASPGAGSLAAEG